jgi:hypothetical protein
MEDKADPQRLSAWLAEIVATAPDEIDCDALSAALESLANIAESNDDIRELLPGVATHLDHCPECRDVFESLRALCHE